MAVVEVHCLDCVAEPVRFRWRVDDMPTLLDKHLRRKCPACSAVARARKKKAAAEARIARDEAMRERGRMMERRYQARRQRQRRKQLQSVPKALRTRLKPPETPPV